jgi:hypothetical protein
MIARKIFSLDTERDADIIRWLGSHSNQSATIRAALRAQFTRQTEYTLADVMQRLDDLQRSRFVTQPVTNGEQDEPREAVIALDGLGM